MEGCVLQHLQRTALASKAVAGWHFLWTAVLWQGKMFWKWWQKEKPLSLGVSKTDLIKGIISELLQNG